MTISNQISVLVGALAIAAVTGCDPRLGSTAKQLAHCTHTYGGLEECPPIDPCDDGDGGCTYGDVDAGDWGDDGWDAGGGDGGGDDTGWDAGGGDDGGLDAGGGDDGGWDAPPGDGPVCEHATTTLPDLIEGLTALDCDTSATLLQQILDELAALRLALDCDDPDDDPLCDEDRAAIEAAIEALHDLTQASDCEDEQVQGLIDSITYELSRLRVCVEDDDDDDDTCDDDDEDGVCDCVDSDNDGICDDDDDDDDTGACGETEWSRLGPPPAIGGNCTVITVTGGGWDTAGDVAYGYPLPNVPGAATEPFSSWERPYNDYFAPLWPSSDLLDNFGLTPSQIGVLRSVPGTYQLFAHVDLGPLQPALAAADHVVVILGRTNATSIYLEEYPQRMVLDDLIPQFNFDYEYTPHRDSIRVLDCDADELIGKRGLSFGTRVAMDPPWVPYLADQPAVWAAVLACGPEDTTPTPTPPTTPTSPIDFFPF